MKALPQAIAGMPPERDHGREVERGDARAHAHRLMQGIHVDAGAGAMDELALLQMGDADAELRHFQAAGDVAHRIGDGLAMLARHQFGERLHVAVQKIDELHQHPGAALGIDGRPARLRRRRASDRRIQIGGRRQRHLRLDLPRRRIEHIATAPAIPRKRMAVNVMGNLAHQELPLETGGDFRNQGRRGRDI
jgi:hypothetical protein